MAGYATDGLPSTEELCEKLSVQHKFSDLLKRESSVPEPCRVMYTFAPGHRMVLPAPSQPVQWYRQRHNDSQSRWRENAGS